MAVGDVYRMAIISKDSAESNECVNVLHFKQLSSPIFDSPEEDLAQRWADDCLANYTALFGANLAVNQLQVRSLTIPVTGIDFPISGGTGTASGSEYLPRTVSGIIAWRTAFIGRSFRGRSFLPPGTESIQNDGFITSGYATGMATYAQSVLDMAEGGIFAGTWQLVIHSDTLNVDTPVTFFQIRTLLGGQNRRRQGRGA